MNCELCGKNAELFVVMIEGTQVQACLNCSRFGKVIRKPAPPVQKLKNLKKEEPLPVEQIVVDYAQRIRTAREKRALTQEEFAKLIKVKESLVHKMETDNFEPSLDLARQLEKILHITLVEVRKEGNIGVPKNERASTGMTIGDILKFKR